MSRYPALAFAPATSSWPEVRVSVETSAPPLRDPVRPRRLMVVRETARVGWGDPDPVGAPCDASSEPTDPFDDMDALEDLGDEIATLAAHIHAATQRMLILLADFDRRRGWEIGGHRSCAHWLAYRTGIDLGAARERVRTARVLVGLPRISAAMGRGELSFSQVRALSRVATPGNEADLLELARGATTAQIERVVRGWKLGSRQDEATRERERHERRTLSVFPTEDGMVRVKGLLEPEVGALLMRAIEAAGDVLYREERGVAAEMDVEQSDETLKAAAQRRADALGLLAERAMAAGFGGDRAPISGTRAERYQVVLHVDEATLRGEGVPAGPPTLERSHLDDGTRVSAETSRRLSCDCGLVTMTHGSDRSASILDLGRRTRTISPALRRALEARDHGCRFPGCGSRFTDGHHVAHWADGGETSLANTLLLCRHHHRLIHEGGWRVEWWGPGRPVFFDPRGGTHFDGRWKAEETPDGEGRKNREGRAAPRHSTGRAPASPGAPVAGDSLSADSLAADALIRRNHDLGIRPDHRTAGARWKRLGDLPDNVLFRAMEALE